MSFSSLKLVTLWLGVQIFSIPTVELQTRYLREDSQPWSLLCSPACGRAVVEVIR